MGRARRRRLVLLAALAAIVAIAFFSWRAIAPPRPPPRDAAPEFAPGHDPETAAAPRYDDHPAPSPPGLAANENAPTLAVDLTDAEGHPVPDVDLELDDGNEVRRATLDANGRAAIGWRGTEGSETRVTAIDPRRIIVSHGLGVLRGRGGSLRGIYETLAEASVAKGAATLSLRASTLREIRVEDPQGVPVADARIEARFRDDETGRRFPGDVSRSGAAGTARIVGLDARERYRLLAWPPDSRPDLARFADSGWMPKCGTVRLPLAVTLRGKVIGGDGKPVAGARVLRVAVGEETQKGMTDDDGRFAFDRLPAGESSRVRVDLDGMTEADVARTEVVLQNESKEAEIRLGPFADLAVTVVPAANVPVDRVLKFPILRWEGIEDTRWHVAERITALRYRFRGLASGRRGAILVTTGSAWVGLAEGITGGDGEVAIPLVYAQTIRGRLTVPGGDPAFTRVWTTRAGFEFSARPDETWRYSLTGLPPGRYEVFATAAGGKGSGDSTARGAADAGGTLDLTLRAP